MKRKKNLNIFEISLKRFVVHIIFEYYFMRILTIILQLFRLDYKFLWNVANAMSDHHHYG